MNNIINVNSKNNKANTVNNSKVNSRNYLIDTLRGITILSMVLYHGSYDYFIIFGRNTDWLKPQSNFLWQQSICISFIIISGMVWSIGKKHALKRGLLLLALGTLITFVTLVFMPDSVINYGILTFMGIATLFMIPIDQFINRKIGRNISVPTESSVSSANPTKDIINLVICLGLFALTKRFPNGYIGTRSQKFMILPKALYKYSALAPIGFPPADFFSSDYFPLIPWIFMYILGYFFGKLVFSYQKSSPRFNEVCSKKIPLLSWLGTKSLLIYLLHQPICYAIVWLICR